MSFAAQRVSTTSASQSVTLSNTGTAALAISSFTVTGDFALTNNCGTSLASGNSCSVNVTFTPTARGTRSGTVTLNSNAPGTAPSIALTGTGIASIAALSPSSLVFGNQILGTASAAQAITLTNSGDATLNISGLSAGGDFAQTNNCGSVVAANSSCAINITFTPGVTGARAGTFTVADDSLNGSPQTATLSGTGTQAATTTTLSPSLNPAGFGQSVTFTASVQISSGPSPTGTVTFLDGTTSLGIANLANGTAQFSTSALATGSHSITAKYSGDANFTASTSSVLSESINPASTSTALSSNLNPASYGQSVTLSATVQPPAGMTATGSVTFLDGSTSLGAVALSNNTAQLTVATLAAGSHSITATYGGSTNLAASTSPVLAQTVSLASTTTTAASSANPSVFSQLITLSATIRPSFGGNATGTVTFLDGTTTLGTSSAVANAAQLSVSTLATGSHSITARYNGDANSAGSTSSAFSQTVSQSATSTSVASSLNPSIVGQSVTFTATVQVVSGNSPTGTVTFLDGTSSLGAVSLANSAAQFSTSALATGSHSITARYSGDANFAASTSSALTQVVNPVASSGIAIDVQASADQSTARSTISTPAFSTTARNELLLAFIATDYTSGSNTTVTGVSGGGLTWVLVLRENKQRGTSEIWRAFSSSHLSNTAVTATLSLSVASSITVVTFTGVDTSGTNGSGAIGATAVANAPSGAPKASLVTTRNNSWVFGVGNDFDNAISRTLGSGQTIVHQYLATVGDTYWVQRQNTATPLSGTNVTINDTAPTRDRYNLAICEVLPAP
ncbi:MAG TPA: Ig-like domain repeat protein [Candidatus Acidoferrum sp.]